MKFYIFLLLLFLTFSCRNSEEKNQESESVIAKESIQQEIEKDSFVIAQDSAGFAEKDIKPDSLFAIKSEKIIEKAAKFQKMSKTDSFILKPFNLYKFKKEAGESNSGFLNRKKFYFKPAQKGAYYYFFMFFLKDYSGKSAMHETALEIVTFKPEGKYRHEYLDPNETLIELEAIRNIDEIPELAFIGLDTSEIHQILGKENFIKNNCLVYHYNKRALILGLKKNSIRWLRWIYLNKELTEKSEIKDIYEMQHVR